MAQGSFYNSAQLSATVEGTNLVLHYSLATTAGWVTLLRADEPATLRVNPEAVEANPRPATLQGEYVVPITPGASGAFYRLVVEQTPRQFWNFPDLAEVIPANLISITGTGANRVFQYTHDTFNGGKGPLVIRPF